MAGSRFILCVSTSRTPPAFMGRVGAGAAVTCWAGGADFGVSDILVSTALSTGKTLDAAMSKTGC